MISKHLPTETLSTVVFLDLSDIHAPVKKLLLWKQQGITITALI